MKVLIEGYSYADICKIEDEKEKKRLKEKALEYFVDYAKDDFSDWEEMIISDWTEKLEKFGFEYSSIQYTGFCSQGDGACFTATPNFKVLFEAFIDELIELVPRGDDLYKNLKEVFFHESVDSIFDYFDGDLKRTTSHYSNHCSVNMDVDVNADEIERLLDEKGFIKEFEDETMIILPKMVDGKVEIIEVCSISILNQFFGQSYNYNPSQFKEWLEDARIDFCYEIYKELKDKWEELTSLNEVEKRIFEDDWADSILFDKKGNFLSSTFNHDTVEATINGESVTVLDCTVTNPFFP